MMKVNCLFSFSERLTMALMSCVGTRSYDVLLHELEEAVRDNSPGRLHDLLRLHPTLPVEAINYKHLVHQAAWLGNTRSIITTYAC
jgi:hypothetical protein